MSLPEEGTRRIADKELGSRPLTRSDPSSQEGTDHLAQRSGGRPGFTHRVVLRHLNCADAGVGTLRDGAEVQGIGTPLQAAGSIGGKDLGIGMEFPEDFPFEHILVGVGQRGNALCGDHLAIAAAPWLM